MKSKILSFFFKRDNYREAFLPGTTYGQKRGTDTEFFFPLSTCY